MEANKFGRALHTALIIKPPVDQWDQIQEIRKVHDKAFVRWMPHINMSFPFVQPEHFKEVASLIQAELAETEEFEIRFDGFSHFEHGKSSVLYLKPECSGDQIRSIFKKVTKVIPHLDDLDKKSDSGFTPHLTCGQFSTNQIEKVKATRQEKFKPIRFVCDELCLISRDGKDAPFIVQEVVKLKKVESKLSKAAEETK